MAIPDHPWVEERDGAAVRVTMTVGARCNATNGKAMLGVVTHEDGNADTNIKEHKNDSTTGDLFSSYFPNDNN